MPLANLSDYELDTDAARDIPSESDSGSGSLLDEADAPDELDAAPAALPSGGGLRVTSPTPAKPAGVDLSDFDLSGLDGTGQRPPARLTPAATPGIADLSDFDLSGLEPPSQTRPTGSPASTPAAMDLSDFEVADTPAEATPQTAAQPARLPGSVMDGFDPAATPRQAPSPATNAFLREKAPTAAPAPGVSKQAAPEGLADFYRNDGSPAASIEQGQEPSLWQRVKDALRDGTGVSRERLTNALALAEDHGVSPSHVLRNWDQYRSQAGMHVEPSTGQIAGGVMALPIMAGMMTNPATTLLGLAGYEALSEAESYGISKAVGEQYRLGVRKGLADLLPDESGDTAKGAAEIMDLLAKGGVLGMAHKGVPKAWNAVKESQWYRELTVPERDLVAADLSNNLDGLLGLDPTSGQYIKRRLAALKDMFGADSTQYKSYYDEVQYGSGRAGSQRETPSAAPRVDLSDFDAAASPRSGSVAPESTQPGATRQTISLTDRIIQAESGGNPNAQAGTSSARGLGQFTKDTRNAILKRHGVDAWSADPAEQRRATEILIEENRDHLRKALGREPSDTDVYMANFLGAGGAKDFLSGLATNPDDAAVNHVSQAAARANRSIFFGKDGSPQTLQQIYDRMGKKIDVAPGASVGTAPASGAITRPEVPFAPSEATAETEPVEDAPAEPDAFPMPAAEDDTASRLDAAANDAATSPRNDLPEPSTAQKEAGNYQKGHVRLQGLDISIENPAGSTRSGTAPDGTDWETEMANHYGYIKGTVGKDKDHLDVFLGPNAQTSPWVFVVNQVDPATAKFDEHKVMLGFDTPEQARAAYLANYQDGWQGLESMASMDMRQFKDWLKSGTTRRQALNGGLTRRMEPTANQAEAGGSRPTGLGDLDEFRAELPADKIVHVIKKTLPGGKIRHIVMDDAGKVVFASDKGLFNTQERLRRRGLINATRLVWDRPADWKPSVADIEDQIRDLRRKFSEPSAGEKWANRERGRAVAEVEADPVVRAVWGRLDAASLEPEAKERLQGKFGPAIFWSPPKAPLQLRQRYTSGKLTWAEASEAKKKYGQDVFRRLSATPMPADALEQELAGLGVVRSDYGSDALVSYLMDHGTTKKQALENRLAEIEAEKKRIDAQARQAILRAREEAEREGQTDLRSEDASESGQAVAAAASPAAETVRTGGQDARLAAGREILADGYAAGRTVEQSFEELYRRGFSDVEVDDAYLDWLFSPEQSPSPASATAPVGDDEHDVARDWLDGKLRFSRSDNPAGQGFGDVATVRRALEPGLRALPAIARLVDVVASEDDLSPAQRRRIAEAGMSRRFHAFLDPETGRITFVAGNIPSEQAAQAALLQTLLRHEGRHKAFDLVFGGESARLDWMTRAAAALPREVAALLRESALPDTADNRAMAAEEILADWAASGKAHAWVDRLLARIAAWVRSIFPKLRLTRAELRAMLSRLDDWLTGKGPGFVGDERLPAWNKRAEPAFGRSENGAQGLRMGRVPESFGSIPPKSPAIPDTGGSRRATGERTATTDEPAALRVEMPEMVRLARELLGRYPAILSKMRERRLGEFVPRGPASRIHLKADIFVGPKLAESRFKTPQEAEAFAAEVLEKNGLDTETGHVSMATTSRGTEVRVYRVDPDYAGTVLAHEIGHLIDYLPDHELKRGNILGHIAGLKKYFKHWLANRPGGPGPLSTKERNRLRTVARRLAVGRQYEIQVEEEIVRHLGVTPGQILGIWNDVAGKDKVSPELYDYIAGLSTAEKKSILREAMRGMVAKDLERFGRTVRETTGRKVPKTVTAESREEAVKAQYRELVRREIEKRRLFARDPIKEELKALSRWWSPFNPEADAKYTAYRYSNEELYADAFSALLNSPYETKSRAPGFYEAFFNYLGERPKVKAEYDAIQDAIRSGDFRGDRVRRLREGFRRGDEAYRAKYERELEMVRPLKAALVNRHAPVFDALTDKRVRFLVEKAVYTGSQREGYLREVFATVTQALEKVDLNIEDLGEYLSHRRVAYERAKMANPQGWTATASQERLREMRAKSYTGQQAETLEKARQDFLAIRREWIIDEMEKARMFAPELMKTIREAEDYATFDVFEHSVEEGYGRGVGAAIHRQVGTLNDITNPYTATVMKDLSVLGSVNWNTAKRAVIEDLLAGKPGNIEPAKRVWNDKRLAPVEPRNANQGMVAYLDDGEIKAYYVDKMLADAFDQQTAEEVSALGRLLHAVANPFRLVFTQFNPGFQMYNVIKDFRTAVINLPGANPEIRFAREYVKALIPAFQSAFGLPPQAVKDMEKAGMFVSVSNPRGVEREDVQMRRLEQMYGLRPKEWELHVWKPMDDLLNWVTHGAMKAVNFSMNVSGAFERVPKIAGYTYLKRYFPGLDENELGHMVRSWAGSPAFLNKGTAHAITNNLILFSNAFVQGNVSMLEAMRANPKQFWWKWAKWSLMPKILMWGMAFGLLGAGTRMVMDGIGEYDKTNYFTVPMGLSNGKSVYLRLPLDEFSRLTGGILWKAMELARTGKAGNLNSLADFMAGQVPSLNPVFGIVTNVWAYASGHNPYDHFRQKPILDETTFKAGGAAGAKAMGKWVWNASGGGMVYVFRGNDAIEVRRELFEEVLRAPFLGNTLGRFVKVSSQGVREQLDEAKEPAQRDRARKILAMRAAMAKLVNGEVPDRDELALLASEKDYLKRTLPAALARRDDATLLDALMHAGTKQEKIAVLQQWRRMGRDEVQ